MLKEALRVGLLLPTRKLSMDEINYLIKREEVASLALQRLLALEISWSDYLDLLEACNVDVDEYLDDIEHNCQIILS